MRILVTAASRHGSTVEIAQEIAAELRAALPGAAVDVVPLGRATATDGHDAAVVGSAVYSGHWLNEARWQMTVFAEAPRGMPVWLFSSGPVGGPAVPDTEPVDATELSATLAARGHAVFRGRLDRERLDQAERRAVGPAGPPDGDHRDWPAVRAWADRLAAELPAAVAAEGSCRARRPAPVFRPWSEPPRRTSVTGENPARERTLP